MAKYISNRQQNLKIGIVSYTEDKTVLEVTGKVGIGTTNAQYSLDVNGNVRITGGLFDNNNNIGAAGSVLSSTGSGLSWIAAASGGGGISNVSISTNTTNQLQYLTYVTGTGSTTGFGISLTGLVFNPSTNNLGIGTTNTQGYELYVNGDANISGIVSATAYFGSGGNLEDIITNISLTKLEGLEVKEEGVGIGTTFTAINFVGSGVTASASGDTAVITITQPVSGISVRYNNINIGTGITSLNFSGTGISSVTSNVSGISTVIVDLQSNLDGGAPDTNYGGIDAIEGGSV